MTRSYRHRQARSSPDRRAHQPRAQPPVEPGQDAGEGAARAVFRQGAPALAHAGGPIKGVRVIKFC